MQIHTYNIFPFIVSISASDVKSWNIGDVIIDLQHALETREILFTTFSILQNPDAYDKRLVIRENLPWDTFDVRYSV